MLVQGRTALVIMGDSYRGRDARTLTVKGVAVAGVDHGHWIRQAGQE